MENGRLTDFFDSIIFQYTEWAYGGYAYFTDGIMKFPNGKYGFFIYQTNMDGRGGDEILRYYAETQEECLNEFKNAKIYDGKSFMEIEPEVSWIDL